jgi:hypothetical protein
LNYPKLVWQITAGDFVCPDGITLADFSVFASAWRSGAGDGNWNPACDISEPHDDIVDELDLLDFGQSYLMGVE